jgi:hypothetical protein
VTHWHGRSSIGAGDVVSGSSFDVRAHIFTGQVLDRVGRDGNTDTLLVKR